MAQRWGWFTTDRNGERRWLGGGTGGELSLTRDRRGPFKTEHGPCGADRLMLRDRFGISDELIDDVVDWWTAYEQRPVPTPHAWDQWHKEREHSLWRRLRAEVPRGVFVQPADYAPEPVLVRMFVDDVSGIALWPNAVGWPRRPSFDEDTLAMSATTREQLHRWVSEYSESIGGAREVYDERWQIDHDRRGYSLSRQLQGELGEAYLVQYEPHSSASDDEGLPRRVDLHRLTDQELETLPALPSDLQERLSAWLDQRSRWDHVSDTDAAAHMAWEDEGMGLRSDLQRSWGPTYNVRP